VRLALQSGVRPALEKTPRKRFPGESGRAEGFGIGALVLLTNEVRVRLAPCYMSTPPASRERRSVARLGDGSSGFRWVEGW
jgi:hypothetical protein